MKRDHAESTSRISGRIEYINDEVPSFRVPELTGETYEDTVPDTLDIQQRCSLAVNGLTGPTDPELDHLMYFYADFRAHPPVMAHSPSDVCTIKFMESLPLMRVASGNGLNGHVDPLWMEMALRMIGPGGLVYWPASPYARGVPDWCEPAPEGARHFALSIWEGRMVGAMTAYMLRDPEGPWRATCQGVVDGLNRLAVREDDSAHFPPGAYAPGPHGPINADVRWKPFGIFASLLGWCIGGLAQFHRHTGYGPAVELADQLSRFLAFHGEYYGPDGRFLPNNAGREWADSKDYLAGPPPANEYIHFQHHATPLLGMTDHAIVAGNRELADFCVRAFEWARDQGCGRLGYFPENVGNVHEYEGSETCQLAAMIGIALKLSAAGLGDYWDDADRWIRNQFAENQLTQTDWVYRVAGGPEAWPRERLRRSVHTPGAECNERVPERNLGAFAGWPAANDWYTGQGSGIMHCCTGNGTRALYYIWEHILSYDNGRVDVNLLLNRPSEWADVHSHLPYVGQVDVVMRKPLHELRVRIPEWATPEEVRCSVNDRLVQVRWHGRYLSVQSVDAGDTVTVTFPIEEQTERIDVEKRRYVVTARGNDVVDVFPRGRYYPLYQRIHYRQPRTRWVKVSRFVSDERIIW